MKTLLEKYYDTHKSDFLGKLEYEIGKKEEEHKKEIQ